MRIQGAEGRGSHGAEGRGSHSAEGMVRISRCRGDGEDHTVQRVWRKSHGARVW